MNKAGKRVDSLQLCFSNKELRKVFTLHLLEQLKDEGGRGIVHVSAEDVPGKFCFCPDCIALEKQYRCIGGPLYDYLIEVCGTIAKAYPQAYVSTLAYRKEQSESPPAVNKLPDNLIVVFAPIDDNLAATLDDPTNQGTLDNLKKWVSIARNVWVWYYTNPYNPETAPIGNVERMAADVKILHQIGVSGTFFEHDSGVNYRFNFSELQTWLLLKLFQNPDQELQPLVVEFTDFYYGPVAPMVRGYLAELESLRKQMTISLPWNPSVAMYRYLSPNNIIRWQKLFDQMENVATDSPQHLRNVKNLRMTLDIVTLDKWQEVRDRALANGMTVKSLDNRIKSQLEDELARIPFTDKQARRDWLESLLAPKRLLASARVKPLPVPLDKIPPGKLRQAFPLREWKPDSEAALSVAVQSEMLELPLTTGVYDNYNAKFILSTDIPRDQLKPGKYHVYKVGQTVLTPNCCFWLTQKWFATIALEQHYVEGDPYKKWDIYASIKVDGPGYGSAKSGQKNVLSCDRVILVECPADGGKP